MSKQKINQHELLSRSLYLSLFLFIIIVSSLFLFFDNSDLDSNGEFNGDVVLSDDIIFDCDYYVSAQAGVDRSGYVRVNRTHFGKNCE